MDNISKLRRVCTRYFQSEQYAKEKLLDLVREINPDEDIPDYDTAYEYVDGYYRVLEIQGV